MRYVVGPVGWAKARLRAVPTIFGAGTPAMVGTALDDTTQNSRAIRRLCPPYRTRAFLCDGTDQGAVPTSGSSLRALAKCPSGAVDLFDPAICPPVAIMLLFVPCVDGSGL